MTNDELQAIEARAKAATPGRWFWDVRTAGKSILLESTGSRYIVMDFVRYGMSGAAPRFRDNDCIMRRADWLARSIPGQEHHRGFDDFINHPDAIFIEHSRQDIDYLLSEVKRLRAEKDAAWISVREIERLPEHLVDVLVSASSCKKVFKAFRNKHTGYWYFSQDNGPICETITHWQPLPPPYSEVQP